MPLRALTEKKLATLRSLSTRLSQKENELRQIQPKNKLEYDNLKNAEKTLEQQIKSTTYALNYCEKILSSIDEFNSTLNKAIGKNYSIDDIAALSTAVDSLSESYEIARKALNEMRGEAEIELALKQEQHQSTVRMLDNFRIRAMKLVPPLASQISQQLNRLKSIATESKVQADFTDLENASKNFLDELSHFIALVNIDHSRFEPNEFQEHAKQVVEAESILNPAHPLRQAVELCYQKTIKVLDSPEPQVRTRSDSMEKTEGYKSKSFAC